jgi:hypothetical protein
MERRLARLESAERADWLAGLVTAMADEAGVDPSVVLARTEGLLADCLSGRPLADVVRETAARTGQSVAQVEATATAMVARHVVWSDGDPPVGGSDRLKNEEEN